MNNPYIHLMRLNKPIGIFLLLWPTLWALWLATHGRPDFYIVCIFVTGVVLMRSAGCVINDFADRHVDGYVTRTRQRPLATRRITPRAALVLFFILCCSAFLLVLALNRLTIFLAFVGAALTVFYPFMKRFTHLPQLGLGLAFAWGVPMAFAATQNTVPLIAWWIFFAATIFPVIYDTMYALIDREDDVKIGIKSTAILFGENATGLLAALQIFFIELMNEIGCFFGLHPIYFASLFVAEFLFLYQLWLIKDQDPSKCFKAFLNNHWVGMIIFLGIFLGR